MQLDARRDNVSEAGRIRVSELTYFLQGVALGTISATEDEVNVVLKQLDEYLPDATLADGVTHREWIPENQVQVQAVYVVTT